jgi:hypothetical protein
MLRAKKKKLETSSPRPSKRPAAVPPAEATLGRLVGLGSAGEAWVDLPALGRKNVPARSTVVLVPEQVGREVLVTWADHDRERPIITGVVRQPIDAQRESAVPRLDAVVDAERVVLTGRREVVLRCGKASITLSADGSVVVKGARLLTSATGVHRIRGGAVQIN